VFSFFLFLSSSISIVEDMVEMKPTSTQKPILNHVVVSQTHFHF
jgi:hypothetical protein